MKSQDRWIRWPIVVGLAPPFCVGLLWSFVSTTGQYDIKAVAVSILVWGGYVFGAMLALSIGLAMLIEKRPKIAMPLIAYATIATALSLNPEARFVVMQWLPDYIHFAIFSHTYTQDADRTSAVPGDGVKWFLWTDTSIRFGGGDDSTNCLVYDRSRQLSLPDSERSASWQQQASTDYARDLHRARYRRLGRVHHLVGGLYVVETHTM